MNDHTNPSFVGARRHVPQFAAAPNKAQPGHMQHGATGMQPHAVMPSDVKNYTVSVDAIGVRLHEIGAPKSKDTIQRYCREGTIDCQKLGMFKRYFATEKSVEGLIKKVRRDVSVSSSTQLHATEDKKIEEKLPVHAVEQTQNITKNQNLDEGVSNRTQEHSDATTSVDEKIIGMQQQQIEDKDKMISFLQDELEARRGAVNALEKIIDAFGDNAQASLLVAKNEERNLNRHSSASVEKDQETTVVHDVPNMREESDKKFVI